MPTGNASSPSTRRSHKYKLQHEGFGLTGFQQIFWLEWIHRFWGRLTGLAFLLPFLYFAVTGQIRRKLLPGLVVIFALGVLQGFVGWFMVSSGFFPNTDHVATVRLVAHLTMALVLYGAILWVAMTEWVPFPTPVPGALGLRRLIWGVLGADRAHHPRRAASPPAAAPAISSTPSR